MKLRNRTTVGPILLIAILVALRPLTAVAQPDTVGPPSCPVPVFKTLFLGNSLSEVDSETLVRFYMYKTPANLSGAQVVLKIRISRLLKETARVIPKEDQSGSAVSARADVIETVSGSFHGSRIILGTRPDDCVQLLRVGDTGIVAGSTYLPEGSATPRFVPFATRMIKPPS